MVAERGGVARWAEWQAERKALRILGQIRFVRGFQVCSSDSDITIRQDGGGVEEHWKPRMRMAELEKEGSGYTSSIFLVWEEGTGLRLLELFADG